MKQLFLTVAVVVRWGHGDCVGPNGDGTARVADGEARAAIGDVGNHGQFAVKGVHDRPSDVFALLRVDAGKLAGGSTRPYSVHPIDHQIPGQAH